MGSNPVKDAYRALRCSLRDKLINKKRWGAWTEQEKNNFAIFASDCTGGMLCHDMHKQFNSPTVNMFFVASDYIKFLKNPAAYMDLPMQEVQQQEYSYPLAKLGDLTLHLVHYDSVAQAQEKWNVRKERLKNIRGGVYCIMNDRNGCTEQDLLDFDALPYEHKVVFTHVPHPEIQSAFYIRGFEKQDYVGTMTKFVSPVSIRRTMDRFDFTKWIDRGTNLK